jgi:hypothetical protein
MTSLIIFALSAAVLLDFGLEYLRSVSKTQVK